MFDERHAQLSGFSEYFQEVILPRLRNGDKYRRKRLFWILATILVIAVSTIASIYGLLSYTQADPFWVYTMGPVIGGLVSYGVWTQGFLALKNSVKKLIAGQACAFFGWDFSPFAKKPSNYSDFAAFGLLPKRHTDIFFSDYLSGSVYETDFEATELFMTDGNAFAKGKTSVTRFRGMLMTLDFKRKFLGYTVVLRDKGVFTPAKQGAMKRVKLVDPLFESAFQAYGTDQVEARYLLTPDVMQRFVNLETSVDGQNIRFGFVKQKLLIAIEAPNRFEAGSMFASLARTSQIQKILDEVSAVYDLVDGLLGPLGLRDHDAPDETQMSENEGH